MVKVGGGGRWRVMSRPGGKVLKLSHPTVYSFRELVLEPGE